ncbi:putative signal transducing protein [Methylobrevis albus]|uniref:DUF2007 domain-containing protein n=1 Tax=Methylobrevis albus TaxID=2793297 RepID=A0A931I2M3_9HYPH|nr:DUF2007 domain-containing protein [Methylobrevis albus]MBH0238126.1 DUF2007 domain-containing protein [Methylobrevis albus]
MEELMRTNDLVAMSFAKALLTDADILHIVADEAASAIDGSIGILPRRLLVDSDEAEAARRLLTDAGLGAELRDRPKR